jgi:hypothetical protein
VNSILLNSFYLSNLRIVIRYYEWVLVMLIVPRHGAMAQSGGTSSINRLFRDCATGIRSPYTKYKDLAFSALFHAFPNYSLFVLFTSIVFKRVSSRDRTSFVSSIIMFGFLRTLSAGLVLAVGLAQASPNPMACSGVCNNAHDPSILRNKAGTYYRFSTGGGIAIHTAPALTGPWTYKGYALKSSKIDGNTDLWVRALRALTREDEHDANIN